MRRVLVGLLALLAVAGLARQRRKPPAVARIVKLEDKTGTDEKGAVRSIQSADVVMPSSELEKLWQPVQLERLARTYWRFLERVTLGLIRVHYTEDKRSIVLIAPPFRLLRFEAPEYEMDLGRGIVRWRIEDGVLVAAAGRDGDGYLEIDVERCDPDPEDTSCERLHIEVEVANFYPAISSAIGRWVYENTQSRIHVIVCYAFLRSLVRLDFAESRVGRFATREEVPGISRRERPSERAASRGRDAPRSAAPSPIASA